MAPVRAYFIGNGLTAMRIVIDGRMILPYMTGVGRYLMNLVPRLLADPSKIELDLWLQHVLPDHHPARNLSHERLHLKTLSYQHMSFKGHWRLPIEVSRLHPDLLHYPHFDLPWLVPGKVVSTIHDLKYIVSPQFFPRMSQFKRLIIKLMMVYSCRRSQRVIADSESTAQDLINVLGIPKTKIRVVHLGVDPSYFQPVSLQVIQALREKYQLPTRFLLFVGENRPHKNILGLIKSFEFFQRMVADPYHLVIAGKRTSGDQILETFLEESNLKESVIFIDSFPDSDLPVLYRTAEAFVFLSFYEGFGLPVLEAMASGTPVVSSNALSLTEVAGNAALIVSPDNPEQAALAIRQMIRGGKHRDSCIQLGLDRAHQFTWEKCAARTISVYQEAMA